MTDATIELYGTHGTSSSRADAIMRTGFQFGKSGRGGAGVYFWAYINDSLYADNLAKSWYLFQKKKGAYKDAGNVNGAIISVSIVVGEGNFLDLERVDIKERLNKFAVNMLRRIPIIDNFRKISMLYDLFVQEVEKRLDCLVDVVHVRVAMPPDADQLTGVPIEVSGAPSCYIVKKVMLITITKMDAIEGA